MKWPSFRRAENGEAQAVAEKREIPLFPLATVLFPGGVLSLKLFEQRYLDMAAACLKDKQPFGVCLIASGQEVGEPAVPHAVGTLAQIEYADMPQLGILLLRARGGRRFRIVAQEAQADGLLRAQVELLAEPACAIPAAQQGLLPLLRKIVGDLGPDKMPPPHLFDDAAWVGYRLTEIISVQMLAKQKLLELDNPVARLEILHTYFRRKKVVD